MVLQEENKLDAVTACAKTVSLLVAKAKSWPAGKENCRGVVPKWMRGTREVAEPRQVYRGFNRKTARDTRLSTRRLSGDVSAEHFSQPPDSRVTSLTFNVHPSRTHRSSLRLTVFYNCPPHRIIRPLSIVNEMLSLRLAKVWSLS